MKRLEIIFLFLIILSSSVWAATYTATKPKDLDLTTPTESSTKVSEFNNSDREIKTVITNLENITTITGTYTVGGTQTGILGSSTSAYTISFPTASTLATAAIKKKYIIKNINTGTITLNLTVDGVGSPTVAGSQTFKLFTDGTSWFEERVNTAANANNAGLLDNLDSTYFTNATNLSTGTVNIDRIPGTLTGKSADLLDEQTGSYYTNASNLDSGTIPLARIPTTLTGKDADSVDGLHDTNIVQTSRTISTTAPLAGGGDLSSNRTIAMATATASQDGFVRKEDFQLFSNKANVVAGSGITSSSAAGTTTITNNGVLQIIAGAGISVSNNGTGTPTITGVGTLTAGGWLETATQTVSTAGLRIVAQGTIAVHADYGITGILDRDIPNTITLDNLTQITTRNYDDITGTTTIKPTVIAIGTTTTQGALNAVGSATFSGTITAGGFSGNGAGLTNVPTGQIDFGTQNGRISVGSQTTGNFGTLTVTTIQATSTASTFGTTTQWNNSILTVFGSGTSPISIVANIARTWSGTNTTETMTGTSTPTPNEVIASLTSGSFFPYLAFDKIMSSGAGVNRWVAPTAGASWIRYDFGTSNTRTVATYNIATNEPIYAPKDWTFEGNQTPQNDATWSVLDTQTTITGWATDVYKTFSISVGSQSAYRSYRLNITASQGGGNTDITEIQLISITDKLNSERLYVDGTGTVMIGTTTANGTSTAYPFQVAGNALASAWNVTCYGDIKSPMTSGTETLKKGYDDVMQVKVYDYHPKIRNVPIGEAEEVAKAEYVKSFTTSDFETFKENRLGSYTISNAGSSTINWQKFNDDFYSQYVVPRYDEFYVLADKDTRIKKKQSELESDKTVTRSAPISTDPSTPETFKSAHDPRFLDLGNMVNTLIRATQYQDSEIKDLKARLKAMAIP